MSYIPVDHKTSSISHKDLSFVVQYLKSPFAIYCVLDSTVTIKMYDYDLHDNVEKFILNNQEIMIDYRKPIQTTYRYNKNDQHVSVETEVLTKIDFIGGKKFIYRFINRLSYIM